MNRTTPEEAPRVSIARAGVVLTVVLALMLSVAGAAHSENAVVPTGPVQAPAGATAPKAAPTPSGIPAVPASTAPSAAPSPAPSPAIDPQAQVSTQAMPGGNPLSGDLMKRAMLQAIPAGGAEMGQRSPRVLANKVSVARAAPAKSQAVAGALPMAPDTGHWTPSFGVAGQDVSAYQGNVDWTSQWNQGSRFAYVKASEGNYYQNENFSQQYNGSRNVGMTRGAYHFAIPNWSSGADQARYFVANGGSWGPDGYTLPPVLDIEYNPYEGQTIGGFYFGNVCYGMSASQMVSWIADFGNTVKALVGRYPVIYSTTDWWRTCTGNSASFSAYPLWIASYPSAASDSPGTLPASWGQFSLWQYSSTGPFQGDSNIWNGDYASLQRFATYGDSDPSYSFGAAYSSYGGKLGNQTSGIACGLSNGGCYQMFQGGAMNWSPGTGAHTSLYGAIRNAWASTGFENGPLGYPTSEQICGQKDGGCYQMFQGGAMNWSPGTGAHTSLYGAIRGTWGSTGFENGPLGYPTSEQICGQKDGGCYQMFQGGAINWSPGTGAHTSLFGPIRGTWGSTGFENGPLGYPTSEQICGQKDGGCYQMFQGGAINWSPGTGAHTSLFGPIRNTWGSTGFENGRLGYPTSEQFCGQKDGGCFQMFQGGAINWSPATGGQLSTWGAIRNLWGSLGYENGRLGYPTSSEICGQKDGGCFQMFQGGAINWSPATGAHTSLYGGIRSMWGSLGFERGALGYPTSEETCATSASCFQDFQGGRISWRSDTGASVAYR
ncbi:GH25 family lysozyme [Arthrobacter sp. KNU40]|uniref:GH25 family lysozyme n=1 Tax=Arthrobacter sp. KNU40 TaxID=3447965 RepID=UPI003F6401CF